MATEKQVTFASCLLIYRECDGDISKDKDSCQYLQRNLPNLFQLVFYSFTYFSFFHPPPPPNVMNLLTYRHGRLQYVSNNLLEILADVIRTPRDVISFGYQLGLSHSSVKKHNEQADVYFNTVSRSGFCEMLRDWRRQVRPSEQVDELHLALQNAGLGHTAEVILHERKYHILLFWAL